MVSFNGSEREEFLDGEYQRLISPKGKPLDFLYLVKCSENKELSGGPNVPTIEEILKLKDISLEKKNMNYHAKK